MSVTRVHKTNNYTVMSNAHFKEKNMSLKAKGLLSLILSLPENWNYTINGLASLSKDNETAVKSAINELKEFGYIVVTKKNPGETKSGRFEYVYDIYEYPQINNVNSVSKTQKKQKQGVKKQGIENLSVENLSVENLSVENTPLYKKETKVSNTKNKDTYKSITHSETERPSKREELSQLIAIDRLNCQTAIDLFEICVEIADCYDTVKIGKKQIPYGAFISRIYKLDADDINTIAEDINANKEPIKNMKNYMLMCLYNGAVTLQEKRHNDNMARRYGTDEEDPFVKPDKNAYLHAYDPGF